MQQLHERFEARPDDSAMVWEDIVDKYAAHGAYMTGYMTFRIGSYDLLPHILTTKKTNCLMPTLITLGYALSGEMAV